ncbi:Hypothetical protein PHPALM_36648 [Phytophthora palmivora]|uniref:PiggyBac transposable element-derived protein domain-containing protein n=1 Tax=Phytophthora palmivora TaxID=4796 RepID=A0A2P4WZE9_9STRA|nr:Hypothetical protein PHPALM_36648 [Phytophthora palmivora]
MTEASEAEVTMTTTDTDALNSEYDDEEDEICFLDDEPDAEIERPPEPEYWGDVFTECRDAPADVDLDAEADVSEFEWPIFEQAEMLDFVGDEQELAKMRKTDSSAFLPDQRYPHLYDGAYGPSDEVVEIADSPLELFLSFMPRTLWRDIAAESTLYHEQHLVERVDRMYLKQTVPGAKTKDYFMEGEAKKGDIKAHEVVIMPGLLVVRTINPQRRHFYDRWSTSSVDAIAGGTFGKFMKRHRFIHILSNLHFTNNAMSRRGGPGLEDALSRACIATKFLTRLHYTNCTSLDEAMIPLHNRHNPTRQYVANKPHKWGTKLFMTCCATSSYCLRLEVYCGKAQNAQEIGNVLVSMQSVDHNAGPAAVMRNLELHPRGCVPPRRDRQVYLGAFKRTGGEESGSPEEYPAWHDPYGRSKKLPVDDWSCLIGCASRDAAGNGGKPFDEVLLRLEVPCPSMMRDYHRWMGGVDVHDQLRLRRYSLLQQTKCKKYYKAVFMGLVDVAIVNAYIVNREVQKRRSAKLDTHAEFLTRLQAQMLELTEADFEERQPVSDTSLAIPTTLPTEHVPRESPDFQLINGQRKRRQRQCKICSNRKRHIGERRATKYYCPGCSPSDKARPHFKHNTLTCHQTWHHLWKNGTERPRPRCGRDIQHREAGSSAGKRKRRRRQANSARESSASEQEVVDSNVENSEREEARGDEDSDHEREEADVGLTASVKRRVWRM